MKDPCQYDGTDLSMYADPKYWIILALVSAVMFGIWHLVDLWKAKKSFITNNTEEG